MQTAISEQDLVGRGNRNGAELFRNWFSDLSETAEQGGQAAYVFVERMDSLVASAMDKPNLSAVTTTSFIIGKLF